MTPYTAKKKIHTSLGISQKFVSGNWQYWSNIHALLTTPFRFRFHW